MAVYFAIILLLAGTSPNAGLVPNAPGSVVREVASPAGDASAEPNLRVGPDGRLVLSWVQKAGDKAYELRFAEYSPKGWSQPTVAATGENWFVNWADFPSVLPLDDGSFAAHWLVKSGAETYAYDVTIAQSYDRGRTWSAPLVPHRDGTKTEHGFVSLLPWADGRVAAFWLDGRHMAGAGHDDGAMDANMTLRFATIGRAGDVADEVQLDSRVCECCQTSAALVPGGAVVAYRNRSEREVRDIAIVRLRNGRWSEPTIVHPDGWEIPGCPVNGPSVAASGERVAVGWFTMAGDDGRVNVAFSSDGGSRFGGPVRVDDGSTLGRVDVEMLEDGSALVAWLEGMDEKAEIRARRVRPDGARGPAITIAATSSERRSGFPQMAVSGGEVVFAWTEVGSTSRVRTAAVPRASFE